MLRFCCIALAVIQKNAPSCKNCVHFRPYSRLLDYGDDRGRCSLFGEKNIVSDEVVYTPASNCRNNETLCGPQGGLFRQDAFTPIKEFAHNNNSPLQLAIYFLLIYLFVAAAGVYLPKIE